MPTYTFRDTETNRLEEHFMSIHDLDAFKEANPHLSKLIDSPAVAYGGLVVPEGMKDRLKEIKKAHPRSTFQVP
jgi:hypothetical protein